MAKVEPIKVKAEPIEDEVEDAEAEMETGRPEKRHTLGRPMKDIDEGRFQAISVTFPPRTLDQVIRRADEEEKSRSEIVVAAVRCYLKGITEEKFDDVKAKEETLCKNLSIFDVLATNHSNDQYACDYIGKNFAELAPFHPATLKAIKERLSSRGFLSNDYKTFLSHASKAKEIEADELAKQIEDAIAEEKLLS